MPKKVLAEEAYAVVSGFSNITLTFYYDDNKNTHENESNTRAVYEIKEKYNARPEWIQWKIATICFDESFAQYTPKSTAHWCRDGHSLKGLENLNTSMVEDMSYMFSNSNFTSLDLSGLNTRNVRDMNHMFDGCYDLNSLSLNGLNTENVKNMTGMFNYCEKLESLDLSSFNTVNVENMTYMFYSCYKLSTIYVSEKWSTENVSNSYSMFSYCNRLVGGCGTKYSSSHDDYTYAHIDEGTSNPGYFTYKKIEEDVPEDIDDTIPSDGGNGQTSGAYTVLQNGTLTFYYDNNRSSKTGTVYDIYTSYTGYPDWAKDSLSITKAVFDVSFANFKPTSTAYWFSCCPKMTEIEGLGRLDTRNVTDMRYMFHNCRSLIKLDTGDFLTSQVTDMSNMVSGCHELSNVDVTCFNTGNVTTMEAMFMDCRSLTEIDVTGFETKNVSTMAHMFRGCSSLSEVNLKNMSIASLTNTYAMFYGCEVLTTIYSNTDWSTGSINNSDYMFGQCLQLKGGNGTLFDANKTDKSYAIPDGSNSRSGYFTIRNGSGTPGGNVGTNGAPVYAVLNNGTLTFYCDNLWNSRSGTRYDIDDLKYSYSDQLRSYRTMPEWIEDRNLITRAVFDPSFANYKPKSTVCWFYSCQSLTAIEGMEYLNTSEVTNMSAMFRFCYSLTDVDVSHMDTHNVTDMSFVFCYCESLSHIDVSKFNTEKVTNMEHMFHTCPVETLDLRSFETSKVTDMNTMFDGCGSLKTIYAKKDKWNTDNVSFSSWMFVGCNSLVGGQGTKYDSNHTDKEYAVIDGGLCAPGYLTGDADDLQREAYAVYKDSVLTFYYDCNINCRKSIEGAVVFTEEQFAKERGYNMPWHPDWYPTYSNLISTAVFDPSFADYNGVETVSFWFYSCPHLAIINGIEYLNTSNVTDMNSMFAGCISLTSLDLSSFDTSKVTAMSSMFSSCRNLTSLNLSSFNTSMVISMIGMFAECHSLTNLDLRSFDTSNVTSMYGMFSSCHNLENLDLRSFNTSNVMSMERMFYDCFSLTSLDLSSFNTSKVTDMSAIFYGCRSLTSLNLSSFNTSMVTDMNAMFSNCISLTSLDLSYFNTSNVTDMGNMFNDSRSLTSVNLSSFNTSSVTNMSGMFQSCTKLTSLILNNFNTSNVTTMERMFCDCWSLANLDLSSFKTSNVTTMGRMFEHCRSLTNLNLNVFRTDNVTNMNHMFWNCSELLSLDVSAFNTDNVTDMSGMFSGCSNLTNLDVSGFNTDNVTSMGGMFSGCSSLTSLDVSGFKTDNVTDMSRMFDGCYGLTSIDVNSFKTDNVTNMGYMFSGCSGLTTIYADEAKWSTAKVNSYGRYDMFTGCTNIVGGNGTTFDANHTDIEYARIDKPGLPGYFTQKELQLEPIDIANFSNDIDEDTDLDGNVVGDIYYNISSGDGSYDSVEGCIVVTTLTDDSVVDGQDIFGDNFQANFTGIVFMVPAGEGSIIVDAQTIGTMVLKVKIGDNNPIEKELEGRLKVSFPYNISEPTYVYIYGGNTAAARGLADRAAGNGALKLYGIEVSSDAAGISIISNPSSKVKGSYYTLDGQMLQGEPTQKGVYIHNGNKVVFK